jgi:hypothetical protein
VLEKTEWLRGALSPLFVMYMIISLAYTYSIFSIYGYSVILSQFDMITGNLRRILLILLETYCDLEMVC